MKNVLSTVALAATTLTANAASLPVPKDVTTAQCYAKAVLPAANDVITKATAEQKGSSLVLKIEGRRPTGGNTFLKVSEDITVDPKRVIATATYSNIHPKGTPMTTVNESEMTFTIIRGGDGKAEGVGRVKRGTHWSVASDYNRAGQPIPWDAGRGSLRLSAHIQAVNNCNFVRLDGPK